jgi:hypothetical protein
MSHLQKFLPAIALAATLAAPFAANARSVRAPEQPAQAQLLVGQYNTAQAQGRAGENFLPTGSQLFIITAPQYAALTVLSHTAVN